jgi:FPC/CPF motif-containing protein YcgG
MNAKQQNQQRRHQRSATDTSHADQQPDAEARKRVERIDHAWIIANLHRLGPGDNEARSITGIAGCSARAASGQAAAPPSSDMNSRRPMKAVI